MTMMVLMVMMAMITNVRMYDDGNADDDNGCCEAMVTTYVGHTRPRADDDDDDDDDADGEFVC